MHLSSFFVTFEEYTSDNFLDQVLLSSTFRGNFISLVQALGYDLYVIESFQPHLVI